MTPYILILDTEMSVFRHSQRLSTRSVSCKKSKEKMEVRYNVASTLVHGFFSKIWEVGFMPHTHSTTWPKKYAHWCGPLAWLFPSFGSGVKQLYRNRGGWFLLFLPISGNYLFRQQRHRTAPHRVQMIIRGNLTNSAPHPCRCYTRRAVTEFRRNFGLDYQVLPAFSTIVFSLLCPTYNGPPHPPKGRANLEDHPPCVIALLVVHLHV